MMLHGESLRLCYQTSASGGLATVLVCCVWVLRTYVHVMCPWTLRACVPKTLYVWGLKVHVHVKLYLVVEGL